MGAKVGFVELGRRREIHSIGIHFYHHLIGVIFACLRHGTRRMCANVKGNNYLYPLIDLIRMEVEGRAWFPVISTHLFNSFVLFIRRRSVKDSKKTPT